MKNILLILTLFYALTAGDKQDDPAFKIYYKAYEFVLGQEWDKAIEQFEKVISEYPKSDYFDDSKFWIAYSTKEKGELENAVNLFTEFIDTYKESNLIDQAIRNRSSVAKKLVKQGRNEYKKFTSFYVRKDDNDDDDDDDDDDNDEDEDEDYDDDGDDDKDELVSASIQALANQGEVSRLYEIANSNKYSIRVREKAIFWYGQSGASKLDDLLNLFKQLNDGRLKEKVIFAISQKGTKKSAETLFAIAQDSKYSKRIREKAIFWIGNGTRSPEYLEKLLTVIKDEHLREKLMFSISNSGLSNRAEILRKIALDKNEAMRVREKAIFWIGNGTRDVTALKQLYASLSNERLQEKMIFALHQVNTDAAIDYMIQLLKMDSTPTRVKKKIIFWLGQSKSSKAKKAISDILN